MKKFLAIFFCVLSLFSLTSCGVIGGGDTTDNNLGSLFKEKHTVTLVIEGASNKTVSVTDGEVLTINFTPDKNNYIFKGWYTNSSCTVEYDFSRPVTTDFKLYAGFTLKTKTINCQDVVIKALSTGYDYGETFGVSLVGYDYDYLESNGMGLQFNISYNVRYEKDYNVLWNMGYAGSPRYELSLYNSSLHGYFEENLPTTTSNVAKFYTYNTLLNFSRGSTIKLKFSTDNVQNKIYFSDIEVVVDAIRLR